MQSGGDPESSTRPVGNGAEEGEGGSAAAARGGKAVEALWEVGGVDIILSYHLFTSCKMYTP